jgi:Domain of unknown function (DUF5122) beta-propeller
MVLTVQFEGQRFTAADGRPLDAIDASSVGSPISDRARIGSNAMSRLASAVAGAGVGLRPTFALARYDSDGSLDTSFGGDGKVATDFRPRWGRRRAFSLAFQADGQIMAVGPSGCCPPNVALARFLVA